MAKDIRVPGVLWALLLIAVIAFIHENESALALDPLYIDLIVLAFVSLLKTLSLGDDQLQRALDVIEEIRKSAASQRPRGTLEAPAGLEAESDAVAVRVIAAGAPERPNKVVRWLLG